MCGAGTRIGKQNAGKQRYGAEIGEKLPRAFYNTYLCHGATRKTGFHVAMREDHLDLLVTEVVLARIQRPDFLARVGQEDNGVDEERAELLTRSADTESGSSRCAPRLSASATSPRCSTKSAGCSRRSTQKRLESLTATDPMISELAGSNDVEARWEQLSIVDKPQVNRLLVEPRIHRVGKDERGKRGSDAHGHSGRDHERCSWLAPRQKSVA